MYSIHYIKVDKPLGHHQTDLEQLTVHDQTQPRPHAAVSAYKSAIMWIWICLSCSCVHEMMRGFHFKIICEKTPYTHTHPHPHPHPHTHTFVMPCFRYMYACIQGCQTTTSLQHCGMLQFTSFPWSDCCRAANLLLLFLLRLVTPLELPPTGEGRRFPLMSNSKLPVPILLFRRHTFK